MSPATRGDRDSGRSFLHRHTVLLALLFAAVVLAGLAAYEMGEADRQIQRARLAVLQELNTVRATLGGAIQRDVALIRGLVVDIGIEPDLGEQEFDRFVAGLLRQQTFITHIAAAQDFIVTRLYPRKGNEAVMGLDYRTLPEQLAVIRKVLAEGRIRVAGPLDLVQGGRGLIIRAPVHRLDISSTGEIREGSLWGFVSAVIDYDALVRATGITDPTYPLDVAIRGKNSLGEKGETFFGDPAVLKRDPVLLDVALPSGSWQLAAVPRTGWTVEERLVTAPRLATAMILLTIFVFVRLKLSADAERAAAHRVIERSEKRFRTLFNHAEDGILIIDLVQRCVADANLAAVKMLGTTAFALRGAPIDAILAPHDRETPDGRTGEKPAALGPGLSRTVLRRIDGSTLPVEISAAEVDIGEGRMLIAHFRDITDWIEREERLHRAQVEAERANRLKSRFLANFSHEIRTPLNAIVGFSEIMQKCLFGPIRPARYAGYVEDIHKSATHLLGLINAILDLSRIEAGEMPLSPEWLPLDRVVDESCNIISPLAEKRGIALESNQVADSIQVHADAMRLRQILINLLNNAVKFTDRGGQVSVSARRARDGGIELCVRDTGCGMTPEEIHDALRPFGQVARHRARAQGGSGLGLTLTRALAQIQGISMRLESAVGKGTTVRLRFPPALIREDPTGHAEMEETAPPARAARSNTG
ncbi:MAG: PAS domain S-box protein [Alphaproteobacteria bacterium]|nr:MAG: PAS domain S-box protein [Alphaproteobacteria bacterium]